MILILIQLFLQYIDNQSVICFRGTKIYQNMFFLKKLMLKNNKIVTVLANMLDIEADTDNISLIFKLSISVFI